MISKSKSIARISTMVNYHSTETAWFAFFTNKIKCIKLWKTVLYLIHVPFKTLETYGEFEKKMFCDIGNFYFVLISNLASRQRTSNQQASVRRVRQHGSKQRWLWEDSGTDQYDDDKSVIQ